MKIFTLFIILSLLLPQQFSLAGIVDDCGNKLGQLAEDSTKANVANVAVEEKLEPINPLEVDLKDDPDLNALNNDEKMQKSCEASGVCASGERPSTPFKFIYTFVLRTAHEFKESILAVRGKNLRSRPIAMADFIKNLLIIMPGQIVGAMKVNGDLKSMTIASIASGFSHINQEQMVIAENTVFMVWTQSDRGAGATKELVLPRVKNLKEFSQVMKLAYRGQKGFVPEIKERLVGFLTLIPVEIVNLCVMTSLAAALPDGSGFGSLAHLTSMENLTAFAFLFGTYLAFKWSIITKVFDLRGLPIAREWMSRNWNDAKEKDGLRKVKVTEDEGPKVEDNVSGLNLITKDFYRFVRNKKFECSMDAECKFTDETLSPQEYSPGIQYGRRTRSYIEFQKNQLANGRVQDAITHGLAFPIEMTYRYANSLIDGYFVFWLAQRGTPEFLHWLSKVF